jgi:hypothetical protein
MRIWQTVVRRQAQDKCCHSHHLWPDTFDGLHHMDSMMEALNRTRPGLPIRIYTKAAAGFGCVCRRLESGDSTTTMESSIDAFAMLPKTVGLILEPK